MKKRSGLCGHCLDSGMCLLRLGSASVRPCGAHSPTESARPPPALSRSPPLHQWARSALWDSFIVTLLPGDLAVASGPLAGPIPGVWSSWGSGAGSSCPVTPRHPARCRCPGPELCRMEPFSKEVSRASPQQTLFYGASGFRLPHVVHLHSFPCRMKPLRKSRFLSVSAHLLVPESPASLAVSPTLPSSLCPTGPDP